MEFIILGGGCFWCLEAIFQRVDGIESVIPGYAGGSTANPTYEKVCSGTTGHAEVVKIEFDQDTINLEKLLDIFWKIHDPTTQDQQGNDVGTQYRSIILYNKKQQKKIAAFSLKDAEKSNRFKPTIVTEIIPLEKFYPAENYHQNYYRNNPNQPYCALVISPKLKKFESIRKKN